MKSDTAWHNREKRSTGDPMPHPALIALLLASLPTTIAAQDSTGRTLEQRVDRFVRPYVASNNFTGVILVRRGGRVQLNKGYGMANYELSVPNSGSSRLHIASVTKAFTAAAVLLLAERGKLKLDDPVSRHLPDYPQGDLIRIKHLLEHTAGIPNLGSGATWEREERLPHSTEQLVGLFKDLPLDFEPGSETRYSNSNYNLLTLILEKLSGQEYESFLQDNIFTPLGLGATSDGHWNRAGRNPRRPAAPVDRLVRPKGKRLTGEHRVRPGPVRRRAVRGEPAPAGVTGEDHGSG
jgi:CubicO group peptidase (beta-lactamase class C family)